MTASPKPTKDEALKLALDALETLVDRFMPVRSEFIFSKRMALDQANAAILPIREAIAQPAADDKAGGEVAPDLDVRKIMIGIVPGPDGEGVEVYAQTVADVVRLLSDMGQRLEDYEGTTRPQPQAEALRVPDGYALVPVEPTDEMRDAGNEIILDRGKLFRAWKAMLSAAPQPDRVLDGWQPIETAPKDSEDVLTEPEPQQIEDVHGVVAGGEPDYRRITSTNQPGEPS